MYIDLDSLEFRRLTTNDFELHGRDFVFRCKTNSILIKPDLVSNGTDLRTQILFAYKSLDFSHFVFVRRREHERFGGMSSMSFRLQDDCILENVGVEVFVLELS